MKHRLLSIIILFAMTLSIFVADTPFLENGLSFLATKSSAAGPGSGALLMSLTRKTASAAQTGNKFHADFGEFAEVSELTAWHGNQQVTIGGTGRTPIVINYATLKPFEWNSEQVVGWQSASVVGIDNASAYQLKFSTTGYNDIRFSTTQKSTETGPNSFKLAYRIGETGAFTEINGSKVDVVRVGNNSYNALEQTYYKYSLPAALSNQAVVYLRVYFDGLENIGASGNTSINDIRITSGEYDPYYDDDDDDDDYDDDDAPKLHIRWYHNGVYVGENYNRFVTANDTITVRAGYLQARRQPHSDPELAAKGRTEIVRDQYGNGLRDFVIDPTAIIHYTDNNTLDHRADLGPNTDADRLGNASHINGYSSGGILVGTNTLIANRIFARHAGGEKPTKFSERYPLADGLKVPAFAESVMEIYTISVVAFRGSEEIRDTQSFLLRASNNARITNWDQNDFMIFSVYSDSRDLYDHNDGILVPGIIREEWVRDYQRLNPVATTNSGGLGSRPDGDGPYTRPDFVGHNVLEAFAPTLPANFNKRGRPSERLGHAEAIDPKGVRVASVNVGLRVKGGWSRGTNLYEQRTFEFYARNEYDHYAPGDTNRWSFPLFGEKHTDDGSGNIINRYRRFRVRNGGSDRDRSHLRDEMAAILWKQAGYPITQDFRPAVVFLNGGYYGMAFMKMPRTENHWARELGGESGNFKIIQNGERASTGCVDSNETCGRIIPGLTCQSGCVAFSASSNGSHATGCRVNTRSYNGLGSYNVGFGAGTYKGYAPPVCNATRPCSYYYANGIGSVDAARVEKCQEYHTEGDDTCDGVRNATNTGWIIQPHVNTCFKSNTSLNPGRQYGACTGCRGTCDWDDIYRLVMGQRVRARDGTDLAATNLATASNEIRLNPNGFTNDNGGNGQRRWVEFKLRMDFDILMIYYALNMWTANEDWPGNNIEWWRYFPTDEEKAQVASGDLHPYLDGRWRPVGQDLEMGFNIWYQNRGLTAAQTSVTSGNNATHPTANTFKSLLNRASTPGEGGHYGAGSGTFMMRGLMGSGSLQQSNAFDGAIQPKITPVCANEVRISIANVYADMFGGSHSTTNTAAVFGKVRDMISAEHEVVLSGGNSDNVTGNPNRRIAEVHRSTVQNRAWGWLWPYWGPASGSDTIQNDHTAIQTFLTNRNSNLITHMNSTLLADSNTLAGTATNNTPYTTGNTNGGLTTAKNWSSRDITVTFGVTGDANSGGYGGGYAIMNTRPIAMENLAYTNATVRDPRESGRAVTGNPSPTITTQYFYEPTAPVTLTAKPYAGYSAVWTGLTSGAAIDPNDPNRVIISAAGTYSNIRLGFVKSDDLLKEQNRTFEIKSVKNSDTQRGWTLNALGDRVERPPTKDTGYVEIRNNSSQRLSTKGMYISDSAGGNTLANRFKFQIPSIVLDPGKSAFFPTRWNGNTSAFVAGDPHNYTSNTRNYFLKRSKMDFNLDSDNRLYLYDAHGEPHQMVEVTVTHTNQSQLRDADGKFRIHNFNAQGVPNDWATRVSKWIGRTSPVAKPSPLPCVGGCGKTYPTPCTCCNFCGLAECQCSPCDQCNLRPAQCICCKFCSTVPVTNPNFGIGGDNRVMICQCPKCEGPCGLTIFTCACSPWIVMNNGAKSGSSMPTGGSPTALGYAEVDYTFVRRTETHYANNKQNPIWRLTAVVRAVGGDLENWRTYTILPEGANALQHQSPWGYGYNWNNTSRTLTLWGNDNGNNDRFHIRTQGQSSTTFTFDFWFSADETYTLIRPCDHNYGAWTQSTTNCVNRTRTCTSCGATQSDTNGTHTFGAVTINPANCTQETGTCTICSQSTTQTIPGKTHTINMTTNCRVCSACTISTLPRTCTAAVKCANCPNTCPGCNTTTIHTLCTGGCNKLECVCECGPRATASNPASLATTVTVVGGGSASGRPYSVTVSNIPSGGDRWVEITFPYNIDDAESWSANGAPFSIVSANVLRIEFPSWWSNSSITIGFNITS